MQSAYPRPYPTAPLPGMTYLENIVRDVPVRLDVPVPECTCSDETSEMSL